MSVDALQEKIRKTKNPSVLVLEAFADWLPSQLLAESGSLAQACGQVYPQLLQALKGAVPAVRVGFGSFAVLGSAGMDTLQALLRQARELGYYVLLDLPEVLSAPAAQSLADGLAAPESGFCFDAVVVPAYAGTDVLKPFLPLCKQGKTVFPVVRTANKSAAELQDLVTGGRLVHTAAADIVYRLGMQLTGRSGYSQVGALASASSADSLRGLRAKYRQLFLLLDGADYPNANAKNCSYAFDKLGHGAAACYGAAVVSAWKDAQDGDMRTAAVEAAERIRRNLTRYISVL